MKIEVDIDEKAHGLIRADHLEAILECLNRCYAAAWAEAFYDAYNDSTRSFATPIANDLVELNKLVGFRK